MTFCEEAIENAAQMAAFVERKEAPEMIEIVDSMPKMVDEAIEIVETLPEVSPEEAPRTPILRPPQHAGTSATKPTTKRRRSFPPLRWDKNGKVRIGKKHRFSPQFVLSDRDLAICEALKNLQFGEVLQVGGRSYSRAIWGGDLSESEEQEVEVSEEPEIQDPFVPELPGPSDTAEAEDPLLGHQIAEEPKEDPPAPVEVPESEPNEDPVEVPEEPKEDPPVPVEVPEEPKEDPPVPVEVPEEPKEDPPVPVEVPEEPKEDPLAPIEIPEEVGLGIRVYFLIFFDEYTKVESLQFRSLETFSLLQHSCCHVLASEESQI